MNLSTPANQRPILSKPVLPATPSKAAPAALLRLSSQDILRGRQEVEIEHNGMLYRFRCTSLGKLILTK